MKLLIIIFLISTSAGYAQLAEEWTKKYTGTGKVDDDLNGIAIDTAGNVIITGYYESPSRFVTVKLNSAGQQQWIRTYNNGGATLGHYSEAVTTDLAGNVYVTGKTRENNNFDVATIKYSSSGTQQWVRTYGGPIGGDDAGLLIAADNQGNVYVCGESPGDNSGKDYVTIKYNSAGTVQWLQRYDGLGSSTDEPKGMVVDGQGNVYVAGRSMGTASGYDWLTVKYNSAGTQVWARRYNGAADSHDAANSICLDNAGNIYIAGGVVVAGTTADLAVIKYNSAGTQQWIKTYDGANNGPDAGQKIKLDATGNIIVAGYTYRASINNDIVTIKYNSAGTQQWAKVYNGPGNGNDEAYDLAIDPQGNIYIAGNSRGIGTGSDFIMMKYNPQGNVISNLRYNGPSNNGDYGKVIALDNTGSVYTAGSSYDPVTGNDLCLVKYSDPSAIHNYSNEIPSEYKLEQNYPNPFNPGTTINYHLKITGYVSLQVFDINGKLVNVLINEKQPAGKYGVTFNGAGLASGTYFYRLETNGFTNMKKMMLIK